MFVLVAVLFVTVADFRSTVEEIWSMINRFGSIGRNFDTTVQLECLYLKWKSFTRAVSHWTVKEYKIGSRMREHIL